MIALGTMRRRRMRTVTPVLPHESGVRDGLSYSVWMPERTAPWGGVVILHGAGSSMENHYDFARAAIAVGLAAIAFDQRGHGASEGQMDARVLDDIRTMTDVLREHAGPAGFPVALRGSSMGGYLAILAAPGVTAQAVVAICPASSEGLARGLAAGGLGFDADSDALGRFLAEHDLHEGVAALQIPLLLLHAEGDERVPVQHSRELAELATAPGSRLIAVPGGHHRSVQHDPELRAVSLRFLERVLKEPDARRASSAR
jgi:alpha-beta hydrolase superfamily lysophospholipase